MRLAGDVVPGAPAVLANASGPLSYAGAGGEVVFVMGSAAASLTVSVPVQVVAGHVSPLSVPAAATPSSVSVASVPLFPATIA